jgi:AcrR family transcriptional regulator
MKFDPDNINSMSARRTLKSLQESIIDLMETQPIEKISVMDLCEKAMVPRATFYNYFEDKYDLLHFCWQQLEAEIKPVFLQLDTQCDDCMKHLTKTFFANIVSDMEKWQKIRRANIHDILVPDLFNYLADQAKSIMNRNPNTLRSVPCRWICWHTIMQVPFWHWRTGCLNIATSVFRKFRRTTTS